jgi:hypothetical protein
MIQKMKGGGVIMDFLLSHQTELYILYVAGLIVLCIYLYYIFFYKSNITKTTSITSEPSFTPSSSPLPTKESIKNKLLNKFQSTSAKIKALDASFVAKSLKGKLDNWGDDIDRLPANLRENVISCYQNPQGCIF